MQQSVPDQGSVKIRTPRRSRHGVILSVSEASHIYWHPQSPRRYTVPQLVACLLLMRRLRLSYRDMEQLLWTMDQVRLVLGLGTVPDHTTLQRAFARLRASTWHLLLQRTADALVQDGE